LNENALESTDDWELGTDDVNFDGYAELYVATSRGSVNNYAYYFLYIPSKQRFEDLNTFPVFKLDRVQRNPSTYVKNRSAG
jgi:hypothetical protein